MGRLKNKNKLKKKISNHSNKYPPKYFLFLESLLSLLLGIQIVIVMCLICYFLGTAPSVESIENCIFFSRGYRGYRE